MRKAYYKLSLRFHPDKNKTKEAVGVFRRISLAYEVLGDVATKADYDDMLANPDNFYVHKMRYYRHRMARVRASTVLFWLFVLASLAHFLYWRAAHRRIMDEVRRNPQVREKVRALRQERERKERAERAGGGAAGAGTAGANGAGAAAGAAAGTDKAKTEAELEAERERQELEDVMSVATVGGWQGRAPTVWDTLPVLTFSLPYHVYARTVWTLRWVVGVGMFKWPLRDGADKEYATASALGLDWGTWRQVPAEERARLTARRLWEEGSMREFKREALRERSKHK